MRDERELAPSLEHFGIYASTAICILSTDEGQHCLCGWWFKMQRRRQRREGNAISNIYCFQACVFELMRNMVSVRADTSVECYMHEYYVFEVIIIIHFGHKCIGIWALIECHDSSAWTVLNVTRQASRSDQQWRKIQRARIIWYDLSLQITIINRTMARREFAQEATWWQCVRLCAVCNY